MHFLAWFLAHRLVSIHRQINVVYCKRAWLDGAIVNLHARRSLTFPAFEPSAITGDLNSVNLEVPPVYNNSSFPVEFPAPTKTRRSTLEMLSGSLPPHLLSFLLIPNLERYASMKRRAMLGRILPTYIIHNILFLLFHSNPY